MKSPRIIALVIVGVVLIVLATVGVMSLTNKPQVSPAQAAANYLADVHALANTVDTDSTLMTTGRGVCSMRSKGKSSIAIIALMTPPPYSIPADVASAIVHSATKNLCPEFDN